MLTITRFALLELTTPFLSRGKLTTAALDRPGEADTPPWLVLRFHPTLLCGFFLFCSVLLHNALKLCLTNSTTLFYSSWLFALASGFFGSCSGFWLLLFCVLYCPTQKADFSLLLCRELDGSGLHIPWTSTTDVAFNYFPLVSLFYFPFFDFLLAFCFPLHFSSPIELLPIKWRYVSISFSEIALLGAAVLRSIPSALLPLFSFVESRTSLLFHCRLQYF